MQLGKRFDHTSARDDEHHDVVKICIIVDALDPRRIRRARIRQRGDDANARIPIRCPECGVTREYSRDEIESFQSEQRLTVTDWPQREPAPAPS
jgi:hypothetical protein